MGKNLQCAWKDGPDLMALHQILHFPYRVMFSCDLTPYAPNPRRHKKVFIKRFVFDNLCCTIHRPGWSCGFFNFFYCIYLLPFSLNKTKYGDFVFIFPSITLNKISWLINLEIILTVTLLLNHHENRVLQRLAAHCITISCLLCFSSPGPLERHYCHRFSHFHNCSPG